MRLVLLLILLLPLAACSTDEDAAGTTNPEVVTPAEVPSSLGTGPAADTTAADPE